MNDPIVARPRRRGKEPSGAASLRLHREKLKALGLTDSPRLANQRECWRRKQASRMAEQIAFVDGYKMSHGCADCGYANHPAALDFDHLPGTIKLTIIAKLRRSWRTKRETLLAEMAKCEVVCANCHRIRTAIRKQWNSSISADLAP